MSKKLYLVETISIYRMRYVLEDENAEYAADSVTSNGYPIELMEFSQHHIDENISSIREIDKEEYLRLFAEDNSYLSTWTEEQKFKFINRRPEEDE